jgi:hypothetical protein
LRPTILKGWDFFDIFFLLNHFSLKEIIQKFSDKYTNTDAFFAEKSLVYFTDADLEPDPNTLEELTWDKVKTEMQKQVRTLKVA